MAKYDPTKPIRDQIDSLGEEVLDNIVHEESSDMAAAVNNGGFKEQIEFLKERRGYSDKEIFYAAHGIDEADEQEVPELKEYDVKWHKCYYASGQERIRARSKEEAEEKLEAVIGDLEGSMQYEPSENGVEAYEVEDSEGVRS